MEHVPIPSIFLDKMREQSICKLFKRKGYVEHNVIFAISSRLKFNFRHFLSAEI
jgi:hypothetical protein